MKTAGKVNSDPETLSGAKLLSQGRPRRLGGLRPRVVSVVLPVRNAAHLLPHLIERLNGQKVSCRLEIVAIDSGSQDDTVSILVEASATVLRILPESFNHGLTRNIGVAHAAGEIVVFLTQRALPRDPSWLAALLDPMEEVRDLAGVSSRLLPRPDADLLTRREVESDLSGSAERSLRRIDDRSAFETLEPEEQRRFAHFHTVSCAIRRSVHDQIPFRRVDGIGEDLLWALEALRSGYAIQHEPSSVAFHSHGLSLSGLLLRSFLDGRGNRQILDRGLSEENVLPSIGDILEQDYRYLGSVLDGRELDFWKRVATFRRIAQVAGYWLGGLASDPPLSSNVLKPLPTEIHELRFFWEDDS